MTQLFMTHPGPLPGAGRAIPGVRPAVDADAPALARLLGAAFEEEWTDARVRRELLDAPDVLVTWVVYAQDPGEIAATASERLLPDQYPGAGYVHYVAVAAADRGRGLGGSITALVLAGFAARGLRIAVLETDDFRVAAVVSYLRLGFIPSYRSDDEQAAWSRLFPVLLPSRRVVTRA